MSGEELIDVEIVDAGEVSGDLLVVGWLKDGDGEPDLSPLPEPVRTTARGLAERSGWRGSEGQYAEDRCEGGPVDRVALRGLGSAEDLHDAGLASWLRTTAREGARNGVGHLSVLLPSHSTTEDSGAIERVVRELALSTYSFRDFRSENDEESDGDLVSASLVVDRDEEETRSAARFGNEVAAATKVTRDLANSPPNVASPEWIASRTAELADEHGLEVEILERDELEERGMGGILAVGGGSSQEPRLVRLGWDGAGSPRVALVGKGVTFDTGGISIKPSKDMEEMKFDKCGACTVIGLVVAAARLELPLRVTAYVPLAENMPDGRAYRPGDIVRTFSGKTVEILNTDAEGRMILADALALAAKDEPDALVEFSTLTGACVVALGRKGAGLYSPSDALAEELLSAAERTGEQLWRMPLWPEFQESLSGHHADLKNIGNRWGGANVAASFLSNFTGDVERWAHLDIAGPSMREENGKKEATGYGVALAAGWLRTLSSGGG